MVSRYVATKTSLHNLVSNSIYIRYIIVTTLQCYNDTVFQIIFKENTFFFNIHWEGTTAYSPDINIIELVCSDLKTFIGKRNCRSIDDLVFSVRLFEQKLTPEYCRRYINHLHSVLKAIIRKKGKWSYQ